MLALYNIMAQGTLEHLREQEIGVQSFYTDGSEVDNTTDERATMGIRIHQLCAHFQNAFLGTFKRKNDIVWGGPDLHLSRQRALDAGYVEKSSLRALSTAMRDALAFSRLYERGNLGVLADFRFNAERISARHTLLQQLDRMDKDDYRSGRSARVLQSVSSRIHLDVFKALHPEVKGLSNQAFLP